MSAYDDGELHRKQPMYVYAIIPAKPGVNATVGATAAASRLDTISAGPFAAVVGDGSQAGRTGRTREQLAPQLLAHQQTIEQIMQVTPLLPVKFGTLAPDAESVRAILERGQAAFETAFRRLGSCIQMEVLVTWDLKAVLADLASDEAIAGLKRKLEQEAPTADVPARAELGKLVKDVLERRRAALAASLFDAVRPVAVDAITYLQTVDHVVLHLVLLLKANETAMLHRCLEALDVANGGRLTFRCMGPSAPYSFATVEVEHVDAEQLFRARRLLEVDPGATPEEVRTAYRRIAKRIHPDLAGTGADGAANMAALVEAYRILSMTAEAGTEQGQEHGQIAEADSSRASATVQVFVRRQEGVF